MMAKTTKQSKVLDLSEFAEEAIPFDVVIRMLGKVNPEQRETAKPKQATKRPKPKNEKP